MTGGGGQRLDRAEAALLALAAAHFLLLAPQLIYPDLNWNYPFPGGDGLEWLSNGLALAGEPVRYTGRTPLLPGILAALYGVGALPLFPLFQQLVLAGLAWALYRLLRAPCGRGPALAVALATLFAHSWRASALEIMAEPLAVLFVTLASAAFVGAAAAPRRYLAAGLWAGLGALTQPIVSLVALPALGIVLTGRRTHLRAPALWVGAALALLLPALWLILPPPGAGRGGIVGARQLALLEPQLASVGFYGAALIDFVGWAGVGAALLALWRRGAESTRFAAALALTIGAFFVFLYDYRAERFLLYLWPAWALLAGQGLAALREHWPGRRALWVAAAGAVVLGTVWPPAVGVDLRAAWAARPEARAVAARRQAPEGPPPDPVLHAGDHSAVWLEPAGATPEDRYATQYRLGNALRRRVKVAPEALYPLDWWGWPAAEPVQEAGALTLRRWRPPGEARRWTLAHRRSLIVPTGAPPTLSASQPPAPVGLERDWRIAAAVDALVPEPDGFVALCPRGPIVPEWVRLLPFELGSSSLFVVTDRELCAAWEAAEEPPAPHPALRVRRTRHLGWPIVVVYPELADGAAPVLE